MLPFTEKIDLLDEVNIVLHNSRVFLLMYFLFLRQLLSVVVKTIFEVLSLIVVLVS